MKKNNPKRKLTLFACYVISLMVWVPVRYVISLLMLSLAFSGTRSLSGLVHITLAPLVFWRELIEQVPTLSYFSEVLGYMLAVLVESFVISLFIYGWHKNMDPPGSDWSENQKQLRGKSKVKSDQKNDRPGKQ